MKITPYRWFVAEKNPDHDYHDFDPEGLALISFFYFDVRKSVFDKNVYFPNPSAVQSSLRKNLKVDPKDHPTQQVLYRYLFSLSSLEKIDKDTYIARIRHSNDAPFVTATLKVEYIDDFHGNKTLKLFEKWF